MTTQNKNVPALRFSEFNDEWQGKKLAEVSIFLDGRRKPLKESDRAKIQGIYPYYGASGIIDYVNDYIFDEDIILLGEDGENIVSRNLPLAFRVSGKCWVNNHAHVIKPNTSTDIDYLTQCLENISYVQYNTGTAQPKLNQEVCRKIPLKFPTLPEQQKIAAFLTVVDEKIQQLTKKKDLLEQYKKGVMQKIFNQEICFKDDNGNDFADWEEKKGNEVFESVSNKNHNSDLPILAITQEFGAIPRDLIDYQISVTDKSVESYKVVEVGDFIISLRSFQGGIEYSSYKGICSPAYIILRSKVSINDLFFKYYLKTDFYIQRMNSKLEGIRDGKMVSYKYFSEIELPFPSLEEQNKIANFFTAIDNKVNLVNQQLEKTKEYKKGLLQQMFI